MGETVVTGMSSVITVFQSLIGGLTNIVTTVTANGNDIMLIGIAATVGGIAISWFKRLTGQKSGKRRG